MLFINNYDRDAEQAKLLAEYAAQRERMETVRVLESEVMTVEEMQDNEDYRESQLDNEFWARGGW